MTKANLYVVHCVDTEGPLEETLDATFDRLRKEKIITLEASLETLKALQTKQIDLGGREEEVAQYIAPERLNYLSTWNQVEFMIQSVTDINFRMKYSSPDGSPYTYSWFIIDVVGYKDNPRRKPMGFHTVWNHYNRMLKNCMYNDVMGWHFHTVPPTQHALNYNTSWTNNDFHEQVLARRIIEKQWFPSLFRAGGVIEKNDLNFWLERFIPFDYSNQNNKYSNFHPGAQSDWRLAPTDWGAYHPSFYDYRKKGDMQRSIFRCLDVNSPICKIDAEEVEAAFIKASTTGSAVLAYTNHDRRDITQDIMYMHTLIQEISRSYPDVNWKYENALEAAKKNLNIESRPSLKISLKMIGSTLFIHSNQNLFTGDIFLAVEEEGKLFYRDNVTMESATEWAYWSPRWSTIKAVGVGAVTTDGQSVCEIIQF